MMNPNKHHSLYYVFFILLYLFSLTSIFCEPVTENEVALPRYEITAGVKLNRGELLQETGRRTPGIFSNFAGGSRITYSRDYSIYFTSLQMNWRAFEIATELYGTGGTETNNTRDEDFYLRPNSPQNFRKIMFEKGIVRDSAYTFSGTTNFADAYGDTVVTHYGGSLYGKYFFNDHTHDGYFLAVKGDLDYTWYRVTDVAQFYHVENEVIFIPLLLRALVYSGNSMSGFLGGGYRLNYKRMSFESSMLLGSGYMKANDFHALRRVVFKMLSAGEGFVFNFGSNYKINSSWSIGAAYTTERLFTDGHVRSTGGFQEPDIMNNFLGKSSIFLSRKEANVAFYVKYFIN